MLEKMRTYETELVKEVVENCMDDHRPEVESVLDCALDVLSERMEKVEFDAFCENI